MQTKIIQIIKLDSIIYYNISTNYRLDYIIKYDLYLWRIDIL